MQYNGKSKKRLYSERNPPVHTLAYYIVTLYRYGGCVAEQTTRYDSDAQGKRFILKLIALAAVIAVTWAIAHFLNPPAANFPKPDQIYTLVKSSPGLCKKADRSSILSSYTGRLILTNAEKARFFIGSDRALEFHQKIIERNQILRELRTDIQRGIFEISQVVRRDAEDPEIYGNFVNCLSASDYDRLPGIWFEKAKRVSPDGNKLIAAKVTNMLENIDRLVEVRQEQYEAYKSLDSPPLLATIFWVNEGWLLLEALYWALLGVVIQLLVRSVEYLRKFEFRPREQYVAYTKLIYGPLIAVFMCLAILIGWIDIGSYEVIAWSIPLFAFIFGYNSRKVSKLLDALSERILGQTKRGIEAGPEAVRQRKLKWLQQLRDKSNPGTFEELKGDAIELSGAFVRNSVEEKEYHK
jgi:hypothetical protein